MSKTKLVLATAGIVLTTLAVSTALPVQTRPQPASAQQTAPFDHSQCQYPTRSTNPPDGCDNSDPCDPAQTKGGSGDCATTSSPTVTPAQPEPVQCGDN